MKRLQLLMALSGLLFMFSCEDGGDGDKNTDSTAPTVNITSHESGSLVSGQQIVVAEAADNMAVEKVVFYVNDVQRSEDTSAPYEFSWDTTVETEDSSVSLRAVASDTTGNTASDELSSILVSNEKTWHTAGSSGFSDEEVHYIRLAVGDDGIPFMAYRHTTGDDIGYGYVMEFDGSSWSQTGGSGFSDGLLSADYPSLSLKTAGDTPCILYRDPTNSNYATCKYSDGTDWQLLGSRGFSGTSIRNSSLCSLDSSPHLFAAFMRGDSTQIELWEYDGAWSKYTDATFGGDINFFYLYVEDQGGTPFPKVFSWGAGNLYLYEYSGESWGSTTLVSGAAYAHAHYHDGILYIIFWRDETTSKLIYTCKWDGSNLTYIGCDPATRISIDGITSSGAYSSRIFASDDGIVAGHAAPDGTFYMYLYDSGSDSWNEIVNDASSNNELAVKEGKIYRAYKGDASKACVDVYY